MGKRGPRRKTHEQEIVKLYTTTKLTYVEIGAMYGVSKQRIEQIVARSGTPKRVRPTKVKKLTHDERILQIIEDYSIPYGPHRIWIRGKLLQGYPFVQYKQKRHSVVRVLYELTHNEKLGTDRMINQCDRKDCIVVDHWKRVTLEEYIQYFSHSSPRHKNNGTKKYIN